MNRPNYISVQPVINDYYQSYSNYSDGVSELTQIPNSYNIIKNTVLPLPTSTSLLELRENK